MKTATILCLLVALTCAYGFVNSRKVSVKNNSKTPIDRRRFQCSAAEFHKRNPVPIPLEDTWNALEEDFDLREVGCPAAEDILPCTCLISVVNTTYLRCAELESGAQLEQVFLADFPDPNIAYMHIENSPFLRTLGDIFNGKSIFQMDVYDSGLEYISEYAFIDSLDTLEVLLISNSYLHESTFPFFTLNLYSRLNSLFLYTTRIEAIPALSSDSLMYFGVTDSLLTEIAADTFQGLSQLTQIFLLHNSIATLETGVFWNIPTLRHVDLSENELTYLESGTFPLADASMSINLYNNSIAVAEPGTFTMPDTTEQLSIFVDFAYNELTIVDEGVFGDIFPFLSYLYLDGNPLVCGCDIAWLVTTPNWTEFVGSYAECADGVLLVDLDPQYYEDNC